MVQIPAITFPSIANIVRGEDTAFLFDGDPNTIYNPTTPGWVSMLNPVITEVLADQKASVCIPRQLQYLQRNANNIGTKMYFVNKATKAKVLIYTFEGQGGYMPDTYRVFDIPNPFDVSRIIFEAKAGGPAYPEDIKLLGDFTEKQIVLKPRTPLPLVNLLGFVCYPWNVAFDQWPSVMQPFDLLRPFRIRCYDDHPNVFANGEIKFHWNQMTNYAALKGMGVRVKDCIQNHPGYPYALGEQRKDPATYLAFARDLQKYAIVNKQNGSPVPYIQAENEIDRSWKSVEEYMDGYAIAALSSACYDGHKGKYPDAGVKQIGGAKFVNPGCATDRTQILHQMRIWSEENRGYRANGSVDFPFDVYEFHWYQSLGGQYAGKPGGMPPEIVINRVQEIVDFFREHCPEMEINIGEYGLDVHPDSDLNAPAYGKYNAQQTRGNWFVRDLMMFAKLGIDAVEWYRLCMDWYDPNDPLNSLAENNGQFFETMDLVKGDRYAQPVNYTRRIVGDYFRQIGDIFRMGFVFDSVVSTSPYVFKFKKSDANLYVIWNLETITWPEGGGRATITENVTQYILNVKGQLLRFVDGGDTMSSEVFNGGSITVDAKPIMVIESTSTPTPEPTKEIYHRGYWTVNGKRTFYINYKDKTWTLANGKYEPI